MEPKLLSTANSNHINNILANAKNNIELEKSLSQALPQNEKSKEYKNTDFSKALLCAAVFGILIMQGIALVKKPANSNEACDDALKSMGDEIKNLKKAIDALKENSSKNISKKVSIDEIKFRSKIPFLKGSNQVFNGVITKTLYDGSRFEILYNNGNLTQSIKFSPSNEILLQKTYNRQSEIKNSKLIDTLYVNIVDSNRGEKLYQNRIFRNFDNGKIEQRGIRLFEKDKNTNTAKEILKLNAKPDGLAYYSTRNNEKPLFVLAQKGKEPDVKVISDGFKLKEAKVRFDDGYKYFEIDTQN